MSYFIFLTKCYIYIYKTCGDTIYIAIIVKISLIHWYPHFVDDRQIWLSLCNWQCSNVRCKTMQRNAHTLQYLHQHNQGALPTQTDHIFRTSLFWDIKQRRFVVIYRRFGKKLWAPSARIKQSKQEEEVLFSVTLEDETDSLETSLNVNLHCVTSQKS